MSVTLEQFGIADLTVDERLDLIAQLWDSISDTDPSAPIPEWHIPELERRRAAADARPDELHPWDEVQTRVLDAL